MQNTKNDKQQKLLDIMAAVENSADTILSIHNKTNSYEFLKSCPYWENQLSGANTLEELYRDLFATNIGKENATTSEYDCFFPPDFFQKERYYGDIQKKIREQLQSFSVFLLRTSEDEAALIIIESNDREKSNQMEIEKINTIQENYLFSMLIDLSTASCFNPNTTEISANRQDYMDITYSQWRMAIANMFMESDRPYFLRISSPEYVINMLEEQPSFHAELQMLNIEGQFIWVRLNFTRTKSFSRENPCFVYTVRDIHEDMLRLLKQESIATAVKEQNETLESANQALTKFFSNLSHEIRTPINGILGINEIILRESGDENILSYAKDIKGAGKFLLNLVNDILDYSKIEAGKMEIIPVEYSPIDMIHNISNLLSTKLRNKELEYNLELSPTLPDTLFGDELRISQVILNLLTNAVKYTEKGSITLTVSDTNLEDGQFALSVAVKDTGIGIKPEDMKHLFGDFKRLDVERNRKIEGTGLGLGIVLGLLSQMQSELKVESEYEKGSTFSFVLPQKVVTATSTKEQNKTELPVHPSTPITAPEKSILVVDDNLVNLKVICALLKPYQFHVDTANSGAGCLEKLQSNSYDLLLLDHHMPQMDGIETLKQIKKVDSLKQLPVVALTANVLPGARDEYLSMGFTDYLEKPINTDSLDQLVHRYIFK